MNKKLNRVSQPVKSLRERKKASSAAVVVAQAKAKNEQRFQIDSIVQTRLERGFDLTTGVPNLIAVFPLQEPGEVHKIDLSFLLTYPKLQPMFAEAILSWGATLKNNTRSTVVGSLRRGFFGYLNVTWSPNLAAEQLDDELLVGFKEYLLNKVGKKGKPWHPTTISSSLDALRSILSAVDSGAWAIHARRIVERIPSGPTGAGRKSEPTEVLGLDQLLLIMHAAEREVLEIEKRFSRSAELLAEGRAKSCEPGRSWVGNRNDYSDLAVCLAALDATYPNIIPDLEIIQADHPPLGYALHHIHGHRKALSYFYAAGRDLVPFVMLLAIATAFNAETLLKLKWSNIDTEKDRAGTPVVEIWGEKDRAAQDSLRRLDPEGAVSSELSLKRLLECLQNISSRIRPVAAPDSADFIFLCIQQVGTKRPKGLGEEVGRGGSSVWKWSLVNFIKDNKLPSFTLKQIRPTVLNLVQFMDGSLEAAQRVGNHKSPITTWKHYTSSAVKKRYRETIGQIILLRERWVGTEGTIDPRRLQPRQEKGAATPGFLCLDPFDSPRPNQQKGKLCKDYGGCPGCPMTAAFPNDPVCVGYYSALEAAIYRSQPVMSTTTWFERWVPVLTDLRALLAMVSPDVLDESRKLSIKLPNVG